MKLFGKKEKSCDCGGQCSTNQENLNARIKVLGSGCKKCNDLESITKNALDELGKKEEITHITDFTEIAKYGVMSTPALVIDNTVVCYGKVPSLSEVKDILSKSL